MDWKTDFTSREHRFIKGENEICYWDVFQKMDLPPQFEYPASNWS